MDNGITPMPGRLSVVRSRPLRKRRAASRFSQKHRQQRSGRILSSSTVCSIRMHLLPFVASCQEM